MLIHKGAIILTVVILLIFLMVFIISWLVECSFLCWYSFLGFGSFSFFNTVLSLFLLLSTCKHVPDVTVTFLYIIPLNFLHSRNYTISSAGNYLLILLAINLCQPSLVNLFSIILSTRNTLFSFLKSNSYLTKLHTHIHIKHISFLFIQA